MAMTCAGLARVAMISAFLDSAATSTSTHRSAVAGARPSAPIGRSALQIGTRPTDDGEPPRHPSFLLFGGTALAGVILRIFGSRGSTGTPRRSGAVDTSI